MQSLPFEWTIYMSIYIVWMMKLKIFNSVIRHFLHEYVCNAFPTILKPMIKFWLIWKLPIQPGAHLLLRLKMLIQAFLIGWFFFVKFQEGIILNTCSIENMQSHNYNNVFPQFLRLYSTMALDFSISINKYNKRPRVLGISASESYVYAYEEKKLSMQEYYCSATEISSLVSFWR